MTHTLTDRQLWRRYVVAATGRQTCWLTDDGGRIASDGTILVYLSVPDDADVDRCLGTPEPPPGPPRFPRAGQGIDIPLLCALLALAAWTLISWVSTALMAVGWLLQVIGG